MQIAVAVFQLRRLIVQPHRDFAILAVLRGVGRVVAEHVVAAIILLGLLHAHLERIAIQERLTARVGGERNQRLLRVVDGGALRIVLRARVDAGAARCALAGPTTLPCDVP